MTGKGSLNGKVAVTGLPSHYGLIITVCFFAVEGPDAPVPYDGDPPGEAATDCEEIYNQVDLGQELPAGTLEQRFSVQRQMGYYYVQVRAILFRSKEGKALAQVETFFFGRRPLHFTPDPEGEYTFPVSWPATPVEELHSYGTVYPEKKRPWWRFW